jgi:hypothetical protein
MSEEQPHDWLFKEIFSVPEHAASHLRSVLPAELVARIDWDSLALENTRLHISGLDAKQADVLLSAQLAGKPALLYVVFEHQSTDDPRMPLRILRYVLGVWSEHVKLNPTTRKLPPFIPCVLYYGPAPWKSPTDVAAMVDVDDETRALLGPLIPSMHFLLDDLTALYPDQLDARTSCAAVRRPRPRACVALDASRPNARSCSLTAPFSTSTASTASTRTYWTARGRAGRPGR